MQDRSDFDGITFQPTVFVVATNHMKEKRTPKLLGVTRRLFPRIQEFKRLLKIDTWNEDRKLTLKDLTSNALADTRKVGVQQSTCPMITTL